VIMAEVFVDTSGWVTYFVRTGPHHVSAVAYIRPWRAHGTQVITTNDVLTELIALMTSLLHISRPRQVSTIEMLKPAEKVLGISENGIALAPCRSHNDPSQRRRQRGETGRDPSVAVTSKKSRGRTAVADFDLRRLKAKEGW
jgi:predicted nucleic acid-binding protein